MEFLKQDFNFRNKFELNTVVDQPNYKYIARLGLVRWNMQDPGYVGLLNRFSLFVYYGGIVDRLTALN